MWQLHITHACPQYGRCSSFLQEAEKDRYIDRNARLTTLDGCVHSIVSYLTMSMRAYPVARISFHLSCLLFDTERTQDAGRQYEDYLLFPMHACMDRWLK